MSAGEDMVACPACGGTGYGEKPAVDFGGSPCGLCNFAKQITRRERMAYLRLTRQQKRCLRALGTEHVVDGASDEEVWEVCQVRPSPTMWNLEAKGLVTRDEWLDECAGWLNMFTPLGIEIVCELFPDSLVARDGSAEQ